MLRLEIERGKPWPLAQKSHPEKARDGDGGREQLQSTEKWEAGTQPAKEGLTSCRFYSDTHMKKQNCSIRRTAPHTLPFP